MTEKNNEFVEPLLTPISLDNNVIQRIEKIDTQIYLIGEEIDRLSNMGQPFSTQRDEIERLHRERALLANPNTEVSRETDREDTFNEKEQSWLSDQTLTPVEPTRRMSPEQWSKMVAEIRVALDTAKENTRLNSDKRKNQEGEQANGK